VKKYAPTDKSIWIGRNDGPRFYQYLECVDLEKGFRHPHQMDSIGLVGFCCDEGVKRNLGRVGSREGPHAIRRQLSNLPVHFIKPVKIYDFGDIFCEDENLEASQQALAQIVQLLKKNRILPIILGGGHEVSWGHFQGLAATRSNSKIGIINFDAHFDLRPLLPGDLGSSGTPFLQIAEFQKSRKHIFHYACVGIQKSSNTKNLFETAQALNVSYLLAEELHEPDGLKKAKNMLHQVLQKNDSIYVTLCLDVFAAAFAPGVSAPNSFGVFPNQIILLLKYLIQSKKIIGFDIAEFSPAYDIDNRTAKLAPGFVCEVIHMLLS